MRGEGRSAPRAILGLKDEEAVDGFFLLRADMHNLFWIVIQ